MLWKRASFSKLARNIGGPQVARVSLLSLCAIWSVSSTSIAGEYYERFVSSFDTNVLRAFSTKSPELVDTNNIWPKLTNTVVSLSKAMADREVSGIRLGMTMEEVVAKWGKPKFMWFYCYGGPRFAYSDADIIFEPGSNSVMRIIIQKLPHLEPVLSTHSSMDKCIRALGSPTLRVGRSGSSFSFLHYVTPSQCRLVMNFVDGDLYKIFLERPNLRPALKE